MSSSNGVQNLLVNVFRPAYTYNTTTGLFTPTVNLANVAYSGNSISVFTAAVGDSAANVYVGSNAGNAYNDLRACTSNTALGYSAGELISNVSNSIYIGNNTGLNASNASNVISIGDNAGGSGNTNIFVGASTGSTGNSNILIGHGINANSSNNLLRIGSNIYGNTSTKWTGIGTDTATSGNNFDVSGNARVSGILSAGAFDVSAIASTNLVVPGYIRNQITPTQFDISDGNISNSAVHTTTGLVGTYLRNALTPSLYDISGGNISNSAVHTTTGLVGTYLRNALTPSLYDISGGNISNSGTTTSTNVLSSGYLRNDLTPTTWDISGGNISNSGSTTTNRIFVRNLYAPSTSDPSAISYINMGTGADGGAGTYSSNLQFLWLRGGGAPFRYAGINFGNYNTGSFMTYNGGTSLVTKYIGAVPTAQSQLDVCQSLFTITSSGNIGINTSAPAYVLDVSSGNTANTMRIQATSYPSILFTGYNDNSSGQVLYDATAASNQFMLRTTAGTPLTFQVGGAVERMRVATSGNVGIGTTAPAGILDVSSTTSSLFRNSDIVISNQGGYQTGYGQLKIRGGPINNSMYIEDASGATYNGWIWNTSTTIYTNTSKFGLSRVTGGSVTYTPITFDASTGFVGIGTNTPLGRLDVFNGGIVVNRLGNITNGTDVSMVVEGSSSVGMYFQKGSNNNNCGVSIKTLSNAVFAERMRVDANTGNVGIGITTPTYILDVSSATFSQGVRVTASNGNFTLQDPRNAYNLSMYSDLNGQGILTGGGRINISTNNQTGNAGINVTGNQVGIGTQAPGYALDVSGMTQTRTLRAGQPGSATVAAVQEFGSGYDNVGTTGTGFTPAVSFQYAGSGGRRHFIRSRHNDAAPAGNAIDFFTNSGGTVEGSSAPYVGNVLAMAVTSSGVGVGNPNPSFTLDVSGTIRGSSNIVSVGTATYSMGATWNAISATSYTDIMSLSFTPKQSGNVTLIVNVRYEVQMTSTGGDDGGRFRLTDGVPNELAINDLYTPGGFNLLATSSIIGPLTYVGTFSGAQTFKLQYQCYNGGTFQIRRGVLTVYELSQT